MENQILISWINDFVFCPASIYFHGLYADLNKFVYQGIPQIAGEKAHSAIEDQRYSTRKNILQGIDVYSSKYNIIGKIDIYDMQTKILTERKREIKIIYDGYIFQLYAQYFCLIDIGFVVDKMQLYSMVNNKMYQVGLPEDNIEMLQKFENIIKDIRDFNIKDFKAINFNKCEKCIYVSLCDKSLI